METLILGREDVTRLLSLEECMDGVARAFRLHAEGKALPPKVLGFPMENGGFHIKAGMLGPDKPYFVTKVNANFPSNTRQYGLPPIQGAIMVFDAVNGKLLAVMDSIAITIIRTGAATGIAARHLAVADAGTVTVCGCGNQGGISVRALSKVRKLEKVFAYDTERQKAEALAHALLSETEVVPIRANELRKALGQSQILVTCTPSRVPYIRAGDVLPGTFIAAVGADSEEKQELFPELVARCKVVADLKQQSAEIGEVHHAIQAGLLTEDGIHAELGSIIAGLKPGRESEQEIILFDSTGTALQDVAAAAIVFEKALRTGLGIRVDISDLGSVPLIS